MAADKKQARQALVPVYIPKEYAKDDAQYVAVNGRRFLIQKGRTVEAPPQVAEILRNAQLQTEAARAYMDGLSK